MPIFDYKCACGEVVKDKLVKSSEADSQTCACGQPMERMVAAPAFQLKGNGWYKTDFSGKKDEARDRIETWTKPPSYAE
jgi:putative FmdB family regulatory protein